MLANVFAWASLVGTVALIICPSTSLAGETGSPKPAVTVTVGADGADLTGRENFAIQKALDQVLAKAPNGGGVVRVLAGTYTLYDSVHIRGPVTLGGEAAKTVLKKASQYVTALAQPLEPDATVLEVKDVGPLKPGWGICLGGAGEWAASFRTVLKVEGNTITMDRPRSKEFKFPLGKLPAGARVQTSFPLIQLMGVEGAVIEDLVLDGNLPENKDMFVEGCRNGAIYMCSATPGQQGGPGGHAVRRCVIRDFAGEGISWQGPADVLIEDVESTGNAASGLHPGTNAMRPVVRNCKLHHNAGYGIYICWDVRQGLFEKNTIENNGRCGISTGHGDSDCQFTDNTIRLNKWQGVLYRNQKPAPDGCIFRGNVIEDNGSGVKLDGPVPRTVLEKNTIRDTRKDEKDRTQKVAITSKVAVTLKDNTTEGEVSVPGK